MIESTSVRGHVSAAGGEKRGLCERSWSITALTTVDPGDHPKGGGALRAKRTPAVAP